MNLGHYVKGESMISESYSGIQNISTHFMYRVYGWMATALCITATTSHYFAQSSFINLIMQNSGLLLVLFLIQLGLVVYLSSCIQTMSLMAAIIAFTTYSIATGFMLSSIFLIYTQESIATTFLITASTFAIMGLYGYFTKTDLSSLGSFLLMALWGLIITMLINLFLRSGSLQFIFSAFGVVIFTLLTAFDTQKIKLLSQQFLSEGQLRNKVAILGALTLYLDFINLFLMMLNFTGKQKE